MKKEMSYFLLAIILLAVLLSGGCSNTFLVTKDGKSYFLGTDREGMYKMLCTSGDLMAILADTQLPSTTKDNLYKYNCGAVRSKEKVGEIYASMSPEQRRELRLVFQKHGYDINHLSC